MRVRIKQDPEYPERWTVESKHWWSDWRRKGSFTDVDAYAKALKSARAILNPVIIEVKK